MRPGASRFPSARKVGSAAQTADGQYDRRDDIGRIRTDRFCHGPGREESGIERQRKRAEQREELAIDAVKKFRDAVQANAQLKNRLDLDELRKALLKEPLEFFRKLRDQLELEGDAQPATLKKLAESNHELASTTGEIGSIPDTIRAYSEAISIYERLAHDHPGATDYEDGLASSYNNIGNLMLDTGRTGEASEFLRRALAIRQRLARDEPASAEHQHDRASSHLNIGNLLRATGGQAEALRSYEQAVEILDRLVGEQPTAREYQLSLASAHSNSGVLLSDTGRLDDALQSLRRARYPAEAGARQSWSGRVSGRPCYKP